MLQGNAQSLYIPRSLKLEILSTVLRPIITPTLLQLYSLVDYYTNFLILNSSNITWCRRPVHQLYDLPLFMSSSVNPWCTSLVRLTLLSMPLLPPTLCIACGDDQAMLSHFATAIKGFILSEHAFQWRNSLIGLGLK